MAPERWTVGKLAKRIGVSVRTLHYYDELGLLSPQQRTEAGYRLYAGEDIARLQRITSLRQLGFPLRAIKDLLDRPEMSPRQIVRLHMAHVREQIALQQELYERLATLERHLSSAAELSAEDFIHTLEGITMAEEHMHRYYTPEQLAELRERAERIGPERMQQVQREWPELIAAVRAEMERGTDPADPRVGELARRWQGLIDEFTGGNPEIARSLHRMYGNEPEVRQRAGVDEDLAAYISKAMAAGR